MDCKNGLIHICINYALLIRKGKSTIYPLTIHSASIDHPLLLCIYIYIYTLWLFIIAMGNGQFIDDFPS